MKTSSTLCTRALNFLLLPPLYRNMLRGHVVIASLSKIWVFRECLWVENRSILCWFMTQFQLQHEALILCSSYISQCAALIILVLFFIAHSTHKKMLRELFAFFVCRMFMKGEESLKFWLMCRMWSSIQIISFSFQLHTKMNCGNCLWHSSHDDDIGTEHILISLLRRNENEEKIKTWKKSFKSWEKRNKFQLVVNLLILIKPNL